MPFKSKQVPMSSKNSRAARNAHARASQEFKTYDTSPIQPKKSTAPYIIVCVVIAVLIIAIVLALVLTSCSPQKRATLPEGEQAVFTVESGEGASSIARSLETSGLIADSKAFVDLINKEDAASSLIPGTYIFYGGDSEEEILEALTIGPSATSDSLVIPEGYTREAIAAEVEKVTDGRITQTEFMNTSSDATAFVREYAFLEEAGHNSLEGYLFPKTYQITAVDTAASVIRMMLSQYEKETADLDWSYPESAGLSQYDALKLASIVEKESNAESLSTIASVFYNRLASDRPYLESDATTAYEVGHDPTAEEVHANTPYSTYTNAGLPPTPICNPSKAALQAVCSPDETDYLFFFTNSDGSHAFSQTYDQHQEAIR